MTKTTNAKTLEVKKLTKFWHTDSLAIPHKRRKTIFDKMRVRNTVRIMFFGHTPKMLKNTPFLPYLGQG